MDNDGLMKAMGAFGGGLGSNGETCGAVVGALASIGLKFGGTTDKPGDDDKIRVYAEEFLKRFKNEVADGCILCRDITQVDWKNPEQVEEYRNSDRGTNCWILVGKTAKVVGEMLEKADGE